MKTSLFNPEIHSLTFPNYNVCGGMCIVALREFYKGNLIDCTSKKSKYKSEVNKAQFRIVFHDWTKKSGWKESLDAIKEIEKRIDNEGKPTILYLDQRSWILHKDHFVVAYAIEPVIDGIQKIYTYDNNYSYHKCQCKVPKNNFNEDGETNNQIFVKQPIFSNYLEINYLKKEVRVVVRKPEHSETISKINGFQAYSFIEGLSNEKAIRHSISQFTVTSNGSKMLTSNNGAVVPVWSYTIKTVKSGSVSCDLSFSIENAPESNLYVNNDNKNLFVKELQECFPSPRWVQNGFHQLKGKKVNTFELFLPYNINSYANYRSSRLILKSNHIQRYSNIGSLITIPSITDISAQIGTKRTNVTSLRNDLPIFTFWLSPDDVEIREQVPEDFNGYRPLNICTVNRFVDRDIGSPEPCEFFDWKFFFGIIKGNYTITLRQNGQFGGASVEMTINQPFLNESKVFSNSTISFNLDGSSNNLYNRNLYRQIKFKVEGSGFKQELNRGLEDRCLIIFNTINKPQVKPEWLLDSFIERLKREKIPIIDFVKINHEELWQRSFEIAKRKHPRLTEKLFIKNFELNFKAKLIEAEFKDVFLKSYNESQKLCASTIKEMTGAEGTMAEIKSWFKEYKKELYLDLAKNVVKNSSELIRKILRN